MSFFESGGASAPKPSPLASDISGLLHQQTFVIYSSVSVGYGHGDVFNKTANL